MAYAGETLRITATVADYDNKPILPGQVTSAQCNLYDSTGNYVFQNQDLTYSTTDSYWYFDWQNSLTGSWLAQCVFVGVNFEVYNYATVKVNAPKVIPTGQPH
jgi:hypothetical protein